MYIFDIKRCINPTRPTALSDLPLVDIAAELHDPRAERALHQLAALHRQLRLPTFVAGTAQPVVLARDLVRHSTLHIHV